MILPLIMPAILSAFLIAFVVSIDEVVVASFLTSDSVTYPIYLYSGLKFPEKTQTLIPIATVMIVLSFALAFAAEVLRRVGERRVGLETPPGAVNVRRRLVFVALAAATCLAAGCGGEPAARPRRPRRRRSSWAPRSS